MVNCAYHPSQRTFTLCQRCFRPICATDYAIFVEYRSKDQIANELICCHLCQTELSIGRLTQRDLSKVVGTVFVSIIFFFMVLSIFTTAISRPFLFPGMVLLILLVGIPFLGVIFYFLYLHYQDKQTRLSTLNETKSKQTRFINTLAQIPIGIVTQQSYYDFSGFKSLNTLLVTTIDCANCGTTMQSSMKFCSNCGIHSTNKCMNYLATVSIKSGNK